MQFLRGQPATGRSLITIGLRLTQFLLTLVQLFLSHRNIRAQLFGTSLPDAAFHFCQIRGFFQHFTGHIKGLVGSNRFQSSCLGHQGQGLGFVLAQGGRGTSRIDTQQHFARFHRLARTHQNFFNHTAVQTLHNLDLARWHNLALATHHFINAGKAGPDNQQADGQQGQPDQQRGTPYILVTSRPRCVFEHIATRRWGIGVLELRTHPIGQVLYFHAALRALPICPLRKAAMT